MFSDYCKLLKRGSTPYIRIELLNADETVRKDITNDIWDISGTINVNKQDGARRTCSIKIDSSGEDFPLNPSDFWFDTKFKVWTGIRIHGEPYLFPQGIFCLTNPSRVYNPNSKILTLQGTDKWCRIDGTMGGVLPKTFKTMFGQDLRETARNILGFDKYKSIEERQDEVPIANRIDPKEITFDNWSDDEAWTDSLIYTDEGDMIFTDRTDGIIDGILNPNLYALGDDNLYYKVEKTDKDKNDSTLGENEKRYIITGTTGVSISTKLYNAKEKISRSICPYTATVQAGKTFADVLKEYAKMMMCNIYYDAEGYLTFKPYSRTLNEVSDFARPIDWHFTVQEREMTGLSLNYNFSKVYNDLIVLGNISNGYQAFARLQNRNPASPYSIDKIGVKTKPPYSDNKYFSDQQCRELGAYYAQVEMELEKSGSVTSNTILHHLNIGSIVTVSTDQGEDRERFLVNGYSISLNPTATMSVTITNMRYFTEWTAIDQEGNVIGGNKQ